jgi:hypothetical protein
MIEKPKSVLLLGFSIIKMHRLNSFGHKKTEQINPVPLFKNILFDISYFKLFIFSAYKLSIWSKKQFFFTDNYFIIDTAGCF